jgi:hypothetical protein
MKELIKPKLLQPDHIIASFCEIDCACSIVKCNKDCQGAGGMNSSVLENSDIMF